MHHVAGATGLDLSVSTLQALHRLLKKEDPVQPISPMHLGYRVFQEILGVAPDVAMALENHFWNSDDAAGVEGIQGMTTYAIENFNRYFRSAPIEKAVQERGTAEPN